MNSSNPIATRYMGLDLRSPLVVSACPLSSNVENIVRMEDSGAGAVVMFSLFEEQIREEARLLEKIGESTTNSFAEAGDFFPAADAYELGSTRYLELIRQAKERVDMPVIASLNGCTPEGWIDYATQIEQAGADAIELNIFFIPADLEIAGAEVERRYIQIVHQVCEAVRLPVAMKINPYLSATGHIVRSMVDAGAAGLVLFNRLYQPDLDTERLKISNDLRLSEPNEIRLPLMWIAALHGRVNASLAATTGVQGGEEVIKYLLAGADVVMTASSLYKHGIEHLRTMHNQLAAWMERKQFQSVDNFRGILSQRNIADTTGFERANYIRILRKAKEGS
ncbi:MAG: dihydroorotate dehydrogenase-like protein [Gammaproteobacteria bacterium]|nr:dihydroorotate dehydrogenase-like protein [Gammaproteobacteria bacterium]